MNFLRHRYQSWLVPYVEGTLDARRRAKLEAQFRRDPSLAAEAEAHRRVATKVRDVSHAAESESDTAESTVWPAIQSRLKPRKRRVAPLMLAGGLCAAACVLAFVTLHGPASRFSKSALPQAPISSAIANNRPGMTASKKLDTRLHKPSHHAPRHANAVVAERPKAHQPEKHPAAAVQESAPMPTDSNLASSDANTTDMDANHDGGYPAARLAVGGSGHFRLAPLVRPLGRESGANQVLPGLRDRRAIAAPPAEIGDDSAAQSAAAAAAPQADASDSRPNAAPIVPATAAPSHRATHRRRHHRRPARHRRAKAATELPEGSSTMARPVSKSASSSIDPATGLVVKSCVLD